MGSDRVENMSGDYSFKKLGLEENKRYNIKEWCIFSNRASQQPVDIWGGITLLWGAVLCIVRYLTAIPELCPLDASSISRVICDDQNISWQSEYLQALPNTFEGKFISSWEPLL